MRLIVEGIDNAGKSTLLARLLTDGGPSYKSPGPASFHVLGSFVDAALDRAEAGERAVYDRFPLISEEVYGPILKGRSVFDRAWWRERWARLLAVSPTIVWCRPPTTVIAETFAEREQLEGVEANLSRIVLAYARFFDEHVSAKVLTYDWTNDPNARRLMARLETAK